MYDARFDPETEHVEFAYGAGVVQKTGEDGDDVDLTLSTARPELGAGLPELQPWNLSAWEEPKDKKGGFGLMMHSEAPAPQAAPAKEIAVAGYLDEEKTKADAVQAAVETSGATVNFVIPVKASIPGDGSFKRVTVAIQDLISELSYKCVPKYSEHAFLSAKLKNESEIPFLAGEMRAFSGSEFVGSNPLKLVASGEEFQLPLGADDRIKIKRKVIHQDKDTSGLFSSKIRWNYEYKVELESFIKHPEELIVQDQIPVSRDSKVTVMNVTTAPKSDTINDQGIAMWKLKLEQNKKQELGIGFLVKYPEGTNVQGL
jgi:uncharacterized protein (TIGR02231 family)